MESIFSVILIFMAVSFYFFNRRSLINRWCALYTAISSVGVIKEAFLYQIVPWIQSNRKDIIAENVYIGIYSVMTWISYSFATPAAFIMGLYFYGLNHSNPRLFSVVKVIICIPAIILSFIYNPVYFRIYQLKSQMFWITYSVYNLSLGAVVIILLFIGVHIEKSQAVKRQKLMLGAIILPATIYILVTIFIIHPLGLERWFKAWQWNIIIVMVSAVAAFAMTFKNGFLGLKLSVQKYDWDSDMDLIGKGADYANHMIKNQTSKMELCIDQLKSQYHNEEIPEELAILSRSILALKNYVDRIKRHSQSIFLYEESCNLAELISDAMSVLLTGQSVITVNVDIPENIFLTCDKSHMTEVFSNVITNGAESIRGNGRIEITGGYDKSDYLLRITDTGTGMNEHELNHIFTPYFTTKNTEKNFGLGLAYCRNVIMKHGGNISAKSRPGKGTTIIIALPSKRIAVDGSKTED